MKDKVETFFRRWGLAIACLAGPLLLGVFANGFLVNWMNSGSEPCAITRQISFSLIGESGPSTLKLSAEDTKQCDEAVAKHFAEAAPMPPAAAPQPTPPATTKAPSPAPATSNSGAAGDKPPPQLTILANHIAGRLNVAYAYAFLLLVSFLAFVFGSGVLIYKRGWGTWLAVTLVFAGISGGIAFLDLRGEIMRGFVADNILLRADTNVLLQFMPATENLRSLIKFGLCFGYLSVGLILVALFLASIRWEEQATLQGLKERLFIIRAGLILGSAILVVVVLASRAVFDWPLSLLVEADRKALAPASDALVRKWGAIGSISLIAAFLPAIGAWYLDRATYRSAPHPKKKADKPLPDAGELEIAPWGTVTSIIAVLAPIIASPIFDAFKSLAAAVPR
jgi:hypothetical protein